MSGDILKLVNTICLSRTMKILNEFDLICYDVSLSLILGGFEYMDDIIEHRYAPVYLFKFNPTINEKDDR